MIYVQKNKERDQERVQPFWNRLVIQCYVLKDFLNCNGSFVCTSEKKKTHVEYQKKNVICFALIKRQFKTRNTVDLISALNADGCTNDVPYKGT